MEFRVTFRTDGDSFETGQELISDVLAQIAHRYSEKGQYSGNIRDVNGNTIGDYGEYPALT